jgi:hypothetical protein
VDAVEPLRQVFQDALEMGDREYAQYALAQRIYTRALSGVPLGDVQTEYGEFLGVFSHGIARESLNGLRPLYMPADLETIDSDVAALDALFVDEPMLSVHWRVIWMVTLCVLSRVGAQRSRLRAHGRDPAGRARRAARPHRPRSDALRGGRAACAAAGLPAPRGAREREADLLTRVRRDTEAAVARARARALCQRWGAVAKVQLMDAEGHASGPDVPDA